MAYWGNKNMGVLFGGVMDREEDEESMESLLFDELFGYNITGAGRWVSLNLRKKKKQGGAGGKKKREKAAAIAAAKAAEIEARVREQQEEQEEEARQAAAAADGRDSSDDEEDDEDDNRPPVDYEARFKQQASAAAAAAAAAPVAPSKAVPGSAAITVAPAAATKQSAAPHQPTEEDLDEDPDLSRPLSRFNAMLAVQRNVLYLYGGIHETSSREYTLDDFHVLQLDKMERWVSLKECRIEGLEWNESDEEDDESDSGSESGSDSSSDDDDAEANAAAQEGEEVQSLHSHSDHEGDGADEDASPEEVAARLAKQEQVKEQARQAYGVLKGGAAAAAGGDASAELSEEERQRTPNPGETLRMFFDRTREYWARRAFEGSHGEVRGKEMRTKGFEVSLSRRGGRLKAVSLFSDESIG